MKKDKLKNLLRSYDEDMVNLGIITGKDILSTKEKMSVLCYILKRYNLLRPLSYIPGLDSKVSPSFTVMREYKDDILSYKITKDGVKKFDRSANRVRSPRKPRTGTDTSKSS